MLTVLATAFVVATSQVVTAAPVAQDNLKPAVDSVTAIQTIQYGYGYHRPHYRPYYRPHYRPYRPYYRGY